MKIRYLNVPLDQAENIDPTIIPKPDYSNVSESVVVNDPIWIEFMSYSQIYFCFVSSQWETSTLGLSFFVNIRCLNALML